MKIFKLLKDILAPKKCYSCKKEWHFLCNDCRYRVAEYESSCFICKEESDDYKIHKNCKNDWVYYDKMLIKYHYDWYYISKMIKDAKYYQKKDILEDFWKEMGELLEQHCMNLEKSILMPVPMYFLRRWKRWYNQSEVLAKAISQELKIPCYNNILYRKYNTRQQSKLSKKDRMKNLKNCFAIRSKHIDILDKKQIILVDDVVSTASTLNEISKLLKSQGVEKIVCVCIASN